MNSFKMILVVALILNASGCATPNYAFFEGREVGPHQKTFCTNAWVEEKDIRPIAVEYFKEKHKKFTYSGEFDNLKFKQRIVYKNSEVGFYYEKQKCYTYHFE